ncbi:MFS transporter [Streptomyces sp. NBC_00158]|uniref:MFS transporter n=1 Tax=Streptomyces sp. NBC_00158 TaxID=2903627 RepID=UPI002F90F480
MVKAYLELLRLPGASAAAVPAALARLAGTMVPIALLLACVQSGRSLAAGAAAGAAYAVGSAVGGPFTGRLMDRAGPSRVLRVTGPLAGLTLAAAALAAAGAPAAAVPAAACAAGLATAPVGASMRALWPSLTEDAALRQRAFSFEATLSELLFILGPTAVTVLATLTGARGALLATAVLLGAGGLAYGQAPAVRARAGRPATTSGGADPSKAAPEPATEPAPVRAAATAVLVAIALTAALSSGLVVAVTASLRDQGSAPELAGTLVALQSAGSVAGGLLYGARTFGGTTYGRYLRLLIVLTLALAALPAVRALAPGLPAGWALALLGVLLVLSGLPMAPAGAEEFQLIGEMTAQSKATQAFAGVGSFIALGGAAGSALTGLVADRAGPGAALCMPAAFTLAALLLSLAARRAITRAVSPAPAPAPTPAAPADPTPAPTPDPGGTQT